MLSNNYIISNNTFTNKIIFNDKNINEINNGEYRIEEQSTTGNQYIQENTISTTEIIDNLKNRNIVGYTDLTNSNFKRLIIDKYNKIWCLFSNNSKSEILIYNKDLVFHKKYIFNSSDFKPKFIAYRNDFIYLASSDKIRKYNLDCEYLNIEYVEDENIVNFGETDFFLYLSTLDDNYIINDELTNKTIYHDNYDFIHYDYIWEDNGIKLKNNSIFTKDFLKTNNTNDYIINCCGVLVDHLDRIWIYGDPYQSYTSTTPICIVYDRNFNEIKRWCCSNNEIVTVAIYAIYEDSLNHIWIGGYGNTSSHIILSVLDSNFNVLYKLYSDNVATTINKIFEDSLHRIWLGRNSENYNSLLEPETQLSGLVCSVYSLNFKILKEYNECIIAGKDSSTGKYNLSTDMVTRNMLNIYEDKNHHIWLCGDGWINTDFYTKINSYNNTNLVVLDLNYNKLFSCLYETIWIASIHGITEDKDGNIWICGVIGADIRSRINKYNINNFSETQYNIYDDYSLLPKNGLNNIYIDKYNNIHITSYNSTNSIFYTVTDINLNLIYNSSDFYNIRKIYIDKYYRLWACLYTYDTSNDYYCKMYNQLPYNIKSWLSGTTNFINLQINAIYEDHLGRIWIGGDKDSSNINNRQCIVMDKNFNIIYCWDGNDNTFIYNGINIIYEDHLNRIWVGGQGVSNRNICIVLNNNFIHIKEWSYNMNDFIAYNINIIYEDRLGRIWIGGASNEGYKNCVVLDNNFNTIKSWDYHDINFVYENVYTIYEDHLGRIWIGGSSKSPTTDSNTGNITYYKHCVVLDNNFNIIKSWNYEDNNNNFIYWSVKTIYEDHLNRIWIGGDGGSYICCIILDNNFNIIKKWSVGNINFIYRTINKIYEDHLGRIWVIGNYYYYNQTYYKRCIIFDYNINELKSWSNSNNFIARDILILYEDKLNRIWIGGDGMNTNIECVVLDNNLNILNPDNINQITPISYSTDKYGVLYKEKTNFNTKSKSIYTLTDSYTADNNENTAIIRDTNSFTTNKLNYNLQNISNGIIKVNNINTDIIDNNKDLDIINKFKNSNYINNVFNNPSYGLVFNDMIIIGYYDYQPNLFVYDDELNMKCLIYEADDLINSMCIYKNYLVVSFEKSIRFYNDKLECIYKEIFNSKITYINSFKSELYICMNGDCYVYEFNNKLINKNIINDGNILKVFINNNELYYLKLNLYDQTSTSYNTYGKYILYNNNNFEFDKLYAINNYKNNIYLLQSLNSKYTIQYLDNNTLINKNIEIVDNNEINNNLHSLILFTKNNLYCIWTDFGNNTNNERINKMCYIKYDLTFIDNNKEVLITEPNIFIK